MWAIPLALLWVVPLSPLYLLSLILVLLTPVLIWAVAPIVEVKRIRLREQVVALVVLVMEQVLARGPARD
jgi:hypothetical protein